MDAEHVVVGDRCFRFGAWYARSDKRRQGPGRLAMLVLRLSHRSRAGFLVAYTEAGTRYDYHPNVWAGQVGQEVPPP